MKYEEREVRNGILINLKKAGISQKIISQVVNLSQQRVSKILVAEARGAPTNLKPPGYQRRLTPEQVAELPSFLERGAESYGFSGAYWTHERVRAVIEKEYEVVYGKKQVGRILSLINWTRQKPQKKEAKQDLQKVEKWKTEELPTLKKKR